MLLYFEVTYFGADTHPPEISPRRLIAGVARRSVAFEGTEAGSFGDDARAPNAFNLLWN